MTEFNVNCPNCDSAYALDESYLGGKVKCPQCEARFFLEQRGQEVVTTLEVTCPKCQSRHAIERQHIGALGECPKCHTEFKLLSATAKSGPASSAAAAPSSSPMDPVASPVGQDAETIHAAEQQVAEAWNIGDVILDLYEVKEKHEGGGMGVVYRVHHKQWNLDLAVKSPRPAFFDTEAQKTDFEKECETWVNLGLHPHTVSCYYVRRLGGIPRVFAEYVEGGSLHEWIRDGRLYEGGHEAALKRMLDIAIQFAWGLHYAHEQGMIHQDVKPANVMMTREGTAKVTDFGLAKARAAAGEEGKMGRMGEWENGRMGDGRSILVSSGGMTPAYCSPEQALKKPLTRRTDIWSWAVSVMEMFWGEVAWPSGTAAGTFLELLLEKGTENTAIPKLPEDMTALLKQCFQEEPSERPKDMTEVAARLRECYALTAGEEFPRPEPAAVELLADSLNNRAVSLIDLGQAETARAVIDHALACDPSHFAAVYNNSLLLWRMGNIGDDDVIAQIETMRQNQPDDWHPFFGLGLIDLERGDLPSAQNYFREAQKRGGRGEIDAISRAISNLGDSATLHERDFERPTISWVSGLAISHDGSLVVQGETSGELHLWDISTGQLLRTFKGHKRDITSVSLSFDKHLAISGSMDGEVRIWDTKTAHCMHTFTSGGINVKFVKISADNRYALSASEVGTVRLWDALTGNSLQEFSSEGKMWRVTSASISDDFRWLAVGGSGDKTLRLWDVGTGEVAQVFRDEAETVCLSPDGTSMISCGRDKALRLWRITDGECVRVFKGFVGNASSISISSDGQFALTCGAYQMLGAGAFHDITTVQLWEIGSGRCLRTFKGQTVVRGGLGFSRDARRAVWQKHYNSFQVWDLSSLTHANRQTIATYMLSRVSKTTELSGARTRFAHLIEEAQSLVASNDLFQALERVREARRIQGFERYSVGLEVWNSIACRSARGQLLGAWQSCTIEGHTDEVSAVFLGPEGRWALSVGRDNSMRLWETTTGCCKKVFERNVWSVSISENGRWALCGEWGGTLCLLNLKTGKIVREFKGHEGVVFSLGISPEGRWALSLSENNDLKLWEVSSGRCLRVFGVSASSFCVSRDWNWMVLGSKDNTLQLWSVPDGTLKRTCGKGLVSSLSLSASSPVALVGSPLGSMSLIDVSNGQFIYTFRADTVLSGGCLSLDGRWAAFCGGKTVQLWEVASNRCVRKLEGHTGEVSSICLSADRRWVLSGSRDKTLRLWELDWELEVPDPVDWDEEARPHLENFLTLHTPYATTLSADRQPTEEEIRLALTRRGKPSWTEEDFKQLLHTLGCAGYGWLRPEGVRRKLEEMAANWEGPPPLEGMG